MVQEQELKKKNRLVDSGWRVTIPKDMREALGWRKDTRVCVKWNGHEIRIKNPIGCSFCPDVVRIGSLGKVVIPPLVRKEAGIYQGQILTLKVAGDELIASLGRLQVRCQTCGAELNVKEVMPNVHLCMRCRESLTEAAIQSLQNK
jgi:bifunctional DNA-binding transcriptional regulator/antitoxin component of YhaV-PrlF toxin-antitoxin module